MLLSNNAFNCWFLKIICLFSSEILASFQLYAVSPVNGQCVANVLVKLNDSSFNASSFLRNEPEFAPHAAKMDSLRDSPKRQAWCPDRPVHDKSTEWLQIEFDSAKYIHNIVTEGKNDGNYGEYVTNYYFDYQRESGLTWFRYSDTRQGELMTGNNDARNAVYKKFIPPLVVNRIRIIPISKSPRQVCLRIGVYGCDFTDQVVEYQIPRGYSGLWHQRFVSFDDTNYDGRKFSNKTWLIGGMGKLTDSFIWQNTLPFDEMPSYVVAWKREANSKDYVDLFFRFRTARLLQSVKLYHSNLFQTSSRPFRSIIIECLDDHLGSLKIETLKAEGLQFITNESLNVDLKNNVAKFVRIKLFFDSEWICLSEVVFSSVDVPSSVTGFTPPLQKKASTAPSLEITTLPMKTVYKSQNMIYYVILVICVIVSVVIFGVGLFFCFLWIKQRQKRRYKNKLYDHRSVLFGDMYNSSGLRTISGNNPLLYHPSNSHPFVPTVTNTAQNIGFRFVHSQFPPCPDYYPSQMNNSNDYEAIDSYWPKSLSQSMSFSNHKQDNQDRQTLLTNPAPDITCNNKNVAQYCSTSLYSSNTYSQPDNEINFPAPDVLPLSALTHDSLNSIYKVHVHSPLKGPLGSTISNFQLAPASENWIELALSIIPDIVPCKLCLKTMIADGEIASLFNGHFEEGNSEVLIVRYKPSNVRNDTKPLFYRQCFSKLREDFSSHPNLLQIIGHSMTGYTEEVRSASIIYANPSLINVVSFFKKLRLTPRKDNVSFACSYISQNNLLHLVKQLAGALSYLNEIGVVHKDVSARNCSIGENYHLVLSDFAIGMDEFSEDYIPLMSPNINDTIQTTVNVQLPLLWMPWEAIIMGNYSTKSDIWSFGVTVWEIFTECQMKPYSALHNQNQDLSLFVPNIIRNAMLIANNHPSSLLPNSRTLDISHVQNDLLNHLDVSKHIRDMMTECWRSDPTSRPTFQKLYSLLNNLISTSRPLDEYETPYQLIG